MRKWLILLISLTLGLLATACGGAKATPTPTATPGFMEVSLEQSRAIAERSLRQSPTFAYDGMDDTLRLNETITLRCPFCWTFVFEFQSRHAGYGDRTGQILAQVITPHTANITVSQGVVTHAILDEKWDMLTQKLLSPNPGG